MIGGLIFFGLGLAIALMVEFLFRFIATNNPKAFFFAIIFYPLYLILVYVIGRIITKKIGKRTKRGEYITYYTISGFIGLILFEWILVGNSPHENPEANQIAMFSYWALLAFIPKIFIERKNSFIIKNSSIIKKFIVIHLIFYFFISVIGNLAFSPGFQRFSWVIWSFTISFPLMNFYFVWFIIKIRDQKTQLI